ncbi:MAG: hypothetical protein KDB60_00590 [Propionibacteriaceae bacterium]|nr:hypothetical protein [Propionibacteriaceae bacterium]
MTTADVERILRESAHLADATDDPELRTLRMAIFIEDVFGITLTDDQLASGIDDDPAALRALLARPASGP